MIILICSAIVATPATEANVRTITLEEAIDLARIGSVDAAVALNELKTAYWEYRSFRAELLPEVNFNATLPGYNRSYNSIQADDGSYKFVHNNSIQMNGELSVNQNIWFTGGSLSLKTSVDFLRDLSGYGNRQFMTMPVVMTLTQPVFGVNNTKWKRRIEPERFKEAKAAFISATEEVTMNAISYYFNLILAKENLAIARQNLENAERLYEIAVAKRGMGQISGNDLLQMELNLLKAHSSLTDCESSLKSSMFKLRSFLGIEEDVDLDPVIPGEVPASILDYEDVLDKALTNNSFSRSMARQRMEAEYRVASAKGDMREITLFAQVGYTGSDNTLSNAYGNLLGSQAVRLGVSIPILDWGRRRGRVKVAQSNLELTESRLKREEMEFQQNIFILVNQLNNQTEQLHIARRADEISMMRYDANVETFMIGKISTLDLNDSQTAKDSARRDYVNQLYYWWLWWYRIRDLTLWDYTSNQLISADFERILTI